MRLIIVRHGIAEDMSDDGSDDSRKLTAEGQKKFKKVAVGIARSEPEIERVYSSTLVRAVETADILVTQMHSEKFRESELTLSSRIRADAATLVVEQLPMLRPSSRPEDFCQWLREHTTDESVIAIVSHEPFVSILCSYLLTSRLENVFEFKKGGAASLDLYIRSRDIKAQLNWFMKPSQLRG